MPNRDIHDIPLVMTDPEAESRDEAKVLDRFFVLGLP